MSETRRGAFRVNLGRPGLIHYSGRSAACIVLDISGRGARVRLVPPVLVPDRVTLETEIAGEAILMPARLRRAEPGTVLAVIFDDQEYAPLNLLLQRARRATIAAGVRPSVERRRLPRSD
jgi:hypothetical protein